MKYTELIAGRVAFDVENDEWVMFVDDGFVSIEKLCHAVNEELARQNQPRLKVGDEIAVMIKRAAPSP